MAGRSRCEASCRCDPGGEQAHRVGGDVGRQRPDRRGSRRTEGGDACHGLPRPNADLSALRRRRGPFAIVFESFHYLALPGARDLTCTVIRTLGDKFDLLAYYSDFRVDNQEAGTPSTGPLGGGPDGGAVTGIGATQRSLDGYCTDRPVPVAVRAAGVRQRRTRCRSSRPRTSPTRIHATCWVTASRRRDARRTRPHPGVQLRSLADRARNGTSVERVRVSAHRHRDDSARPDALGARFAGAGARSRSSGRPRPRPWAAASGRTTSTARSRSWTTTTTCRRRGGRTSICI